METKNIILVWRSGGKYTFKDVQLLDYHLRKHYEASQVYCLTNIILHRQVLGGIKMLPMDGKLKGWWSKINLFSPSLEDLRPFLYMDLDTAVVGDLASIFPSKQDSEKFIALEDFYQYRKLASGLLWVPARSEKVSMIWDSQLKSKEMSPTSRMDYFLRKVIEPDLFFQDLTNAIYTYKPLKQGFLTTLPDKASVICFHGKPQFNEIQKVDWITKYRNVG